MGYVALIPLLPALAFALMAPLPRTWRTRAVPAALLAVFGSLALSVAAFAAVWPGGHAEEPVWQAGITLAHIGERAITLGLALEPASALMLLVVTVVGAGVQVYSLGYMHKEERIGWYYAVLSLFTAAMLALVLSDNFLGLFMSWEVMGLCSYLLIGFWHEQEAPRLAQHQGVPHHQGGRPRLHARACGDLRRGGLLRLRERAAPSRMGDGNRDGGGAASALRRDG